jgi:hypothetical protein
LSPGVRDEDPSHGPLLRLALGVDAIISAGTGVLHLALLPFLNARTALPHTLLLDSGPFRVLHAALPGVHALSVTLFAGLQTVGLRRSAWAAVRGRPAEGRDLDARRDGGLRRQWHASLSPPGSP